MLIDNYGANELSIEDIEKFLADDGQATPPVEQTNTSPATQPNDDDNTKNVTETQAFAHRLKQSTEKARAEERENIAKSLGFGSYAEMQKAKEEQDLIDKGFNPEEVKPVLEELVQKRLADDPRLKELDKYKEQEMKEWAKNELKELKELTNGKIQKLEDIPKNVLEAWKQTGSLKKAYIAEEGESLLLEMRNSNLHSQSRGGTAHMQNPAGTPGTATNNKRPFTEQEKSIYKMFNPDVTDEQLNKMQKEI